MLVRGEQAGYSLTPHSTFLSVHSCCRTCGLGSRILRCAGAVFSCRQGRGHAGSPRWAAVKWCHRFRRKSSGWRSQWQGSQSNTPSAHRPSSNPWHILCDPSDFWRRPALASTEPPSALAFAGASTRVGPRCCSAASDVAATSALTECVPTARALFPGSGPRRALAVRA